MGGRAAIKGMAEPSTAGMAGTTGIADARSARADQAGVQREQLLEIAFGRSTAHGIAPGWPLGGLVGPRAAGAGGPPPRPGRVGVLGLAEIAGW